MKCFSTLIKVKTIYFTAVLVFGFLVTIQQANAQQLIGVFSNMDAGFERQSNGSLPTAASATQWASNASGNGQVKSVIATGGYGGPKYLNIGKSATATQNTTTTGIGNWINTTTFTVGTIYVVQFFYKYSSVIPNNPSPNLGSSIFISADGTSGNRKSVSINLPNTTAWTKLTVLDTASFSVNPTTNGNAGIVIKTAVAGTPVLVDVDNFVVYPADNQAAPAPDVTAPDAVTAVSAIANSPADATVNWSAPSTGIDNGGYVVVRYTTEPTNADNLLNNAVYAVGNPVGSGTVVYIGTSTSFTDASLTGNTQYYYRIFTCDKAFNYANPGNTQVKTSVFNSYYYKGSGDVTNVANWGANVDGTGSNPPNFSAGGQFFYLKNTTSLKLTSAWLVTGSSSKIIVGDATQPAITLTIPEGAPVVGTMEVLSPSVGKTSIILQDSIVPNFSLIQPNTVLEFAAAYNQKIAKATAFKGFTYGDIVIANKNGAVVNVLDTIVLNNLTIISGAILNANNLLGASTFNIVVLNGGSVTVSGTLQTGKTAGLVGSASSTLVFLGAQNLVLNTSSVIDYNKDASTTVQIITARQYANLKLSGTSPKAFESGQILISGNFVNASTYIGTTCTTCSAPTTMVFNGSSNQNIDSLPNPINSYTDVEFTGGGTKYLSDSITISGAITLTSGKVDLNNRKLTLGNSANITFGTGGSSSYFIAENPNSILAKNGIGLTSSFTLPVGTVNHYLPVTITPQASSGSFEVYVFENVTTDGQFASTNTSALEKSNLVNAVWNINRVNGSGDADILVGWSAEVEGSSFKIAPDNTFSLQNFTGFNWVAGTAVANSNTANTAQANFTNFGAFVVNKNNNILPVVFTHIRVNSVGNKQAKIEWTTSNEVNIVHYVVEKSNDGKQFFEISKQVANAAVNESTYQFIATLIEKTFYRIKAIASNGEYTYSKLVVADVPKTSVACKVAVNPVLNKSLQITTNQVGVSTLRISIVSLSGKQVCSTTAVSINQVARVALPDAMAKGTYIVLIETANQRFSDTIVVE
jgi:hypothetical protein